MISSDPRSASTASLRSKPCVSDISPILFTVFAMAGVIPAYETYHKRVLSES
jgi:hypothetical protein